MKVEREVIIDLLPAYFSGEASAATRALVEEYFGEHPEFEKTARSANRPLEKLKVPVAALDEAKAKLAFERARQITEIRGYMLWLAICFTLMLGLFRIQDHKIVWIFWGQSSQFPGLVFLAMTVFFWLFYLRARRLKAPMRTHSRYLWAAILYTILPFLFTIKDHKVVWLLLGKDPAAGIIIAAVAIINWIGFFYQRWKARGTE
jgi:hypothetical protein